MSNILKTLAAGSVSGEYQISRSLRFNSADSAYLSRTPASAGDRKTWTWSAWVKRTKQAEYNALFYVYISATSVFLIRFQNDDKIFVYQESGGVDQGGFTSALFRDPSAWYHIVLAVDTTQATDTNRMKLYVNGSQVTLDGTYGYFVQNADTLVNSTNAHYIGQNGASDLYMNGYLADVNLIDGQALTPSSFGETNETTGVWSPIKFNGPWNVGTGVNGFYLKFSNNSDVTAATLGADYSGNGNNWTPSGSPGFSVTAGAGNDSLVDTPTQYGTDTGAGGQVRGNYCTLNPLNNVGGSTLTNGNLDFVTGSATYGGVKGTIGVSSGKWYWEVTPTAITAVLSFGIQNASGGAEVGGDANGWGYLSDARKYNNGSASAYGASYTTNDVIGVALDLDAGTLAFYKNGSAQGTAFSGLAANTYFPAVSDVSTGASSSGVANFGQRPFAYTAPSGFKALVTTNLPEPTVVQGDDYFNTVLFTGNHPTGQSITGVGFAPDLTWFKSRTVISSHNLVDKVRGAFRLRSDTTDAETSATVTLDSDGFTVGAQSESNDGSMVAWNWKAYGAGGSNTDGTVAGTVTVSANTTAGFSIVTWTNPASGTPTIGHGLDVAPSFIIVKDRTFAYNWDVGSDSIGWANRLNLNTTGATSSGFWNSTAPTASVFTYAASGGNSGDSMVAYCFAEVEGFSKFGSYTGNGLADGPFVYTGFRPAFVMVKNASATNNWAILDAARNPYNGMDERLHPNLSNATNTGAGVVLDALSNGFKCRNSDPLENGSGNTIIYMAFASNPFKYALAR
jgi:hypothetical protein